MTSQNAADGFDLQRDIRRARLERMIWLARELRYDAGEITTAELWQGITLTRLPQLRQQATR